MADGLSSWEQQGSSLRVGQICHSYEVDCTILYLWKLTFQHPINRGRLILEDDSPMLSFSITFPFGISWGVPLLLAGQLVGRSFAMVAFLGASRPGLADWVDELLKRSMIGKGWLSQNCAMNFRLVNCEDLSWIYPEKKSSWSVLFTCSVSLRFWSCEDGWAPGELRLEGEA